MRVVFAPDFRSGTPYQPLLAAALEQEGVEVAYLEKYYRGLPFTRGLAGLGADLFHLHWPEIYWRPFHRWLHYGDDLMLATLGRPLVLTAHNFQPHDHPLGWKEQMSHWWSYQLASAVFVHSPAAAETILRTYRLDERRLHLIPHGNEAAAYPTPSERSVAHDQLGLKLPRGQRVVLMFGAIRPYKGQEAIIDWWKRSTPEATTLALVGQPQDAAYQEEIRRQVQDCPSILLHDYHQDDASTALWHSAADVALFNYRQIFSSGSLSLALGYGLPIVYPVRNTAFDLAPFTNQHPKRVGAFYSMEGDFGEKLKAAAQLGRSEPAALDWAQARSWQGIAQETANVYKSLL